MKKKSLNLIFVFLTALFIISCKNSQSYDKLKNAVVNLNNCTRDCDKREAACWDEYNKCVGQASTEEQTALSRCAIHVPPENRIECKNQAISDFLSKKEECQKKLKSCLDEIRKCREACGNQYSLPPDTR